MTEHYEDINFYDNEFQGKDTPIVDIESDNISTNTHNQIIKDERYIKNQTDEKFWSHYILRSNKNAEDNFLLVLFKINDFRQFLNEKKIIRVNKIEFYLPKYDVQVFVNFSLIPSEENFSVKVEFTEDKDYSKRNLKNENMKVNRQNKLDDFFHINIEKSISNQNSKGENISDSENNSAESFSKEFQEILQNNDVVIDANMGIYTNVKKFFTKNKKEKLKLNIKSEINIEDFFPYEGLVYERLIDPFIFRIKLSTPGRLLEKCEDYTGITNEGNTCYMNSIIQCLFHLRHLRKAIYSIPSAEDSPVFSIQKVFYLLQNEKSSIKLLHLFKCLGWEKSFWNNQQDAQEIFSHLFNILADLEKNYLDDSAELSNLCEGVLNSKISCLDIKFESEKQEKFLFLQLDLENSHNLIQCIEKFISVESLTGENCYETEDKLKHEATRSFMFSKIPEILFVQLKRFKCEGTDIIKMHQKIEYPDQLNLANYYSTKIDELIYSLYAVIVHDGSMNSGHYFVFIKDFKRNKWIKFNDTKVTYANETEVFQQNFGGTEETFQILEDGNIVNIDSEILRTAYILVYVQKDKIDFLFKEIRKEDVKFYLK